MVQTPDGLSCVGWDLTVKGLKVLVVSILQTECSRDMSSKQRGHDGGGQSRGSIDGWYLSFMKPHFSQPNSLSGVSALFVLSVYDQYMLYIDGQILPNFRAYKYW